ncbi:MAG: hypothetical protein GY943_28305 [Chloroflexi bacterium]|nr:hypothetical protein [Chloroflexota bacterium]
MMLKESVKLQPEIVSRKVPWQVMGGVTAVLLIIAGIWLFNTGAIDRLVNQPDTITQDELEAITGVRVSLIAVTANGGFIDFRIKVIDAEKANQFFTDPANIPTLVAESGNEHLTLAATEEYETEFETDRAYYLLYANQQNAVQRGTAVTVILGDMQLEPINAQ